MIKTAFRRMQQSEAEQGVLLAYIVMALAGAGMSFVIVNALNDHSDILRPLSAYDLWMIFAGLIGGSTGLAVGRGWLGWRGLGGVRRALQGGFVITLAASVVAGTLALPLYGTMFGPMLLAATFLNHPLLAGIWVAILFGAHAQFLAWRHERDTIFAPTPDDSMTV